MTAHLTVFQRDLARRLRAGGMRLRDVAREVGCSHSGIDVVLRGGQAREARAEAWTPTPTPRHSRPTSKMRGYPRSGCTTHDAPRTAATLLHVIYGAPANAAASYLGHDPAAYNGVYVKGDTGHDLVAAALSRMQDGVGA